MDFDHLRFQNEALDPETMALLSSAFERAWDIVVKSGAKLAGRETDLTRELLAKRILEMARRGERDVATLINDAIERLPQPMTEPKPLMPE